MEISALEDTGQTAPTLILVYRHWNHLAPEHQAKSWNDPLFQILCSDGRGQGWVKRLEFSVVKNEHISIPFILLDILNLCPNVEVIVKYANDFLPHRMIGANLTSLKRLDWWMGEWRSSRGLDFLREVLNQFSHLQYLSLVNRHIRWTRIDFAFPQNPSSREYSMTMHYEIGAWSLPVLNSVIMDACPTTREGE